MHSRSVRIPRRRLFIAALAVVAACGVTDPTGGLPPGDAQLAVLNALPEGTVAALLLDDVPMTVPAGGQRISRVVPAGEHRLEARATGGRILASAQFAVGAGGRRTAIIGGSIVGGAALVVAADTASLPAAGEVKVRIVNSVPGTPALEAWLARAGQLVDSTARIVSPLAYGADLRGGLPGYALRGAGSYQVRVTDLVTGTTQAQRVVALGSGEVWSVVLIRRGDGELELVPIEET
ncbi:MAG TPA: DUF4397 domain-containing protein [Gemmatimonadales bacterium]|nr:DUF4397 domain-containing protein [Gemmatimonadales bacterium]